MNVKDYVINKKKQYESLIYRVEAFFQVKPDSHRDLKKIEYVNYLFEQQDNNEYYEDFPEDLNVNLIEEDVKLIAFYLPQFYQTDYNDKWHGKGFTEWTNVTRTIPYFKNHYQPQLPIDLGFYDLTVDKIQKRQVELANKFGIYGFCFYYYWFNGKRILDVPLDKYLNNFNLNLPFCLCWANGSWKKTWSKKGATKNIDEMLIEQDYESLDDLQFIKDISKYLRDSRYIKIGGKLLILIYAPEDLLNPKRTFKIWREYCLNEKIGDLLLIYVKSSKNSADPNDYGLDGSTEFPPHFPSPKNLKNVDFINPHFSPFVCDLKPFVENKEYVNDVKTLQYKGVMPCWDNTARAGSLANIYLSSPNIYKKWLKDCIRFTKKNMDENNQIIFINAWNEWAEGCHLEPDNRYGYSYLKTTAESILETRNELNGTED